MLCVKASHKSPKLQYGFYAQGFLAVSWQAVFRQLAGNWQAVFSHLAGTKQELAGSWQAVDRQSLVSWQAVARQLAGRWHAVFIQRSQKLTTHRVPAIKHDARKTHNTPLTSSHFANAKGKACWVP